MQTEEASQMKTAEFTGALTGDGRIAVPAEIASQVPPGEHVQVVLQWGSTEENAAWRAAGRQQFEAAYSADDSIYEKLILGPSTR